MTTVSIELEKAVDNLIRCRERVVQEAVKAERQRIAERIGNIQFLQLNRKFSTVQKALSDLRQELSEHKTPARAMFEAMQREAPHSLAERDK